MLSFGSLLVTWTNRVGPFDGVDEFFFALHHYDIQLLFHVNEPSRHHKVQAAVFCACGIRAELHNEL